jgi:hypothetical protein
MNINRPPVELYFIRHAHSCANMIEKFGAKGMQKIIKENIRPKYAKNPHITNFGISHALGSTFSTSNYTELIQPDIICVSQLIRTWETAYTLFYQYFNKETCSISDPAPLYVCPYIGEKRDFKLPLAPYKDLDNQPENCGVSKEKFDRFLNHFSEYIENYYLKNNKGECKPNIVYLKKDGTLNYNCSSRNNTNFRNSYLTNEPNFNLFMSTILPKLIDIVNIKRSTQLSLSLRSKNNIKGKNVPNFLNKPIKIVIVTHSKFMEENIVKHLSEQNKEQILIFRKHDGKVKVYNCDVYKMDLNPNRSIQTTNLIFPRIDNHKIFDYYNIPPFIGDKQFWIADKNTSQRYYDLYKYNNRFNIDMILGLCGKENQNFRKLILNELDKSLVKSLKKQTKNHRNITKNGELMNLEQRNTNLSNYTLVNKNILNKNNPEYLRLINQRNEYRL